MQDNELGFKCWVCSKMLCSTYRYSKTTDLCWACGIKTPDSNIKYYTRKQQTPSSVHKPIHDTVVVMEQRSANRLELMNSLTVAQRRRLMAGEKLEQIISNTSVPDSDDLT
jgi:hypothetical protein